METRSRKRAEASSSSTTRAAKRSRTSSSSSTTSSVAATTAPCVTTRSRLQKNSNTSLMDSSESPAVPRKESDGRRRRNRDKGKEKEAEGSRVRDRDLDVEKRDDMSVDGDGGDDDNDAEGAAGLLHQNFTSASSALQGLLRKLGTGLDDLLPSSALSGSSGSHQSSRLKKMLSGLRAEGEEGKQVEALTQLCDMLSIGTEDSLGSFSVDSFVPVLVGLLNHESNPDIMLLAARALTHLCDVLPSSCAVVVHYGAVSCFVARLLTIEYMDLAEQSLQALKKISQGHPTACLRAGAFMAVLSYLDFFSTGVQRVALSTAANMCKNLPSDAADFVMEAVPLLTNLLNYHDSKVLENASVCLTRIAEVFASSPDRLDELCSHGLIAQATGLISTSNSGGGQASLSIPTYTGLIRLLSTCASGSALGAKTLHLLGISGILKDILSGSGLVSSNSVTPPLTRPPEQMYEIVNLADELLPPLPEGTISVPVNLTLMKRSTAKRSSVCTVGNLEDVSGTKNVISAREQLMQDQPELLQQFGTDLLPVLIQIYASSVNSTVRHKCLSVIAKLMYFSRADMIQSLLSLTNISSFLAGILAWKDPQVLVPALQIAEILMEKLPGIFSKVFVREGVVHAVEMLILPDSSASVQCPSAEKDNDFLVGSSRSRRYRRRSGCLNADAGSTEDSKHPTQGNINSSPGSVEVPMGNSSLKTTVSIRAKAFKDKYFPSDPGAMEAGATDDLIHLKSLCAKLNAISDDVKLKCKGKSKASGTPPFSISLDTEEQLTKVISEILIELNKGDGVSTFEFICSGVVSALLNYLSCGTFSKERVSEANLPKLRNQALRRFKSFIALSLPYDNRQTDMLPMTVLVQKLQSALSSLEQFPVVLSHPSRSSMGNSRLLSGLAPLSQRIKLCFFRARGDKSLRDYATVVLINPLVTLASVEEFLWPRVQRSESGQKLSVSAENSEQGVTPAGSGASLSTPSSASGRRHSTRSRSSLVLGGVGRNDPKEGSTNGTKGKGKAVLKSTTDDDTKGPQTRNAARTKANSDRNVQLEPAKAESSSEEDDLEISPTEVDYALVIKEDDFSEEEDDDQEDALGDDSLPVCPEKVHDVKLGDLVEEAAVASSTSNNPSQFSSGSNNRTITARGTSSDDLRTTSYFSSRRAMSFAAAAMTALASGIVGRGIRGRRDYQDLRPLPHRGSSTEPPKLIFTSGGKPLSRHLTIYEAIQRQLMLDDDDDSERSNGSDFLAGDGTRLWGDIYTITYQRADGQSEQASPGLSTSSLQTKSIRSLVSKSSADMQCQHMSLMNSIVQGELPCDLDKNNSTYSVLALLRVLEALNQLAPRLRFQAVADEFAEGKLSDFSGVTTTGPKVISEEFVNNKLTPKLTRQMQDALALCSGSLPAWCSQLTKACPFLFPFDTRRQYFYSTAFGLSRALRRLQQGAESNSSMSEREVRVSRLHRQKVRVSRNRILDSAAKVMEMYSSQKAVLEVEYFGEVGTGLGPTLEFYTLLSHEFQKVGLQMWRSNSSPGKSAIQDGSDALGGLIGRDTSQTKKLGADSLDASEDFLLTKHGLFPRPWSPSADSAQLNKVLDYFRLLGRVIAKALQDGRLLDLPLSAAFCKLVLGQELDLHDIISFDAEFGKILQEMQLLVDRKNYLQTLDSSNKKAVSDLCFRGTPVEDLCLDFTLPGFPDYILKQGEESTMVDINNLEEYIALVVDATIKSGISRQMEAFRAGFNQVFDIASLQIFSPDELDCLLCGLRELWEAETLVDHIKFDHGYTAKSPAIVNFLEIMGEFTPEQQRAFCQFVTGAPRLPPGGLSVLNPKLTIVRKLSSTARNIASNGTSVSELSDDDLPSVMTCANYLKLPPYSTKEIMRKKLLFAINEGQGSFDLS